MHRGLFIAVEGLDGSGTTTLIKGLTESLRENGHRITSTHEPSDSEIGKTVRSSLTNGAISDPRVLALLFAADRLAHISEPVSGIDAQLAAGSTVITDRYVLSSLAYQHSAGPDLDWLSEINRECRIPDITIFVDTSLETCLHRIRARGTDLGDPFHQEKSLHSVRRAYRKVLLMNRFMGDLITVDGDRPAADVLGEVLGGLGPTLTARAR